MNKVALITGGSRGIGLGIAKCLAKAGYDLAINGVRDEALVIDALAELRSLGVKVVYCQGNIASNADRIAILAKMKNEFGVVNVLVNNAGIAPVNRCDILDIKEDDFDKLMTINQKGTFFVSQMVAKWMLELKASAETYEASIVSITSISVNAASVNRTEYCMSKASLSMMSKCLTIRMAEVGIPVYEVQPGVIETDMTAAVKDRYAKLAKEGFVLERRMGTPEDIGKVVSMLVTGMMPYSTGQIIAPDGGMGIWHF